MNDINALAFRRVLDLPFEEAVEQVTAALGRAGFGVLTEIDVQATLRKKLNQEFRKYKILGACNPPFAYRALSADLEIGLLLPCNVIVYESDDGQSAVGAINPIAMLKVIDNRQLQQIALEVSEKLEKAIHSLGS